MKKHDLISSAFWFLIGLFIVLYAPEFDLGTLSMPGAGLMPFFSGIVICVFAVISFFQAWFGLPKDAEPVWHDIAYGKIIAVLAILIAYTCFFEWLGFIVCTFVMMYVLMNYVGSMKWPASFGGALISALVAYLVFEIWLQAQLPRGVLIYVGM
jgi:putative tricarboxylic transport membrane protein